MSRLDLSRGRVAVLSATEPAFPIDEDLSHSNLYSWLGAANTQQLAGVGEVLMKYDLVNPAAADIPRDRLQDFVARAAHVGLILEDPGRGLTMGEYVGLPLYLPQYAGDLLAECGDWISMAVQQVLQLALAFGLVARHAHHRPFPAWLSHHHYAGLNWNWRRRR